MAMLKRRTIVSVLIVMLLAFALAAFLRECDLLEGHWHALGEGPAPESRTCRWTDVNL